MKSKKLKRRSGQVVVEYILVTVMVVGMGGAAYIALRGQVMPRLRAIKKNLQGERDPTDAGKSAGSGSKRRNDFYKGMRIIVK